MLERVVVRSQRNRSVDLLIEREVAIVQDRADALGAALRVVLDGSSEQVLLRVEVVVGQSRRHAGGARHRTHRHVVVAFLGE